MVLWWFQEGYYGSVMVPGRLLWFCDGSKRVIMMNKYWRGKRCLWGSTMVLWVFLKFCKHSVMVQQGILRFCEWSMAMAVVCNRSWEICERSREVHKRFARDSWEVYERSVRGSWGYLWEVHKRFIINSQDVCDRFGRNLQHVHEKSVRVGIGFTWANTINLWLTHYLMYVSIID